MSKKNSSAKRSWLGRLFFGGSKGLADDIEAKRAAKNDVEEIVSPVLCCRGSGFLLTRGNGGAVLKMEPGIFGFGG